MNPMWQIYLKESRELFRDKRVRSAALFMPLMIVVASFMLIGIIVDSVAGPSKIRIHAVNADHPIARTLATDRIELVPAESRELGEKLVLEGKAKLVLVFPAANVVGQQVSVEALFDPKEERGQIQLRIIREAFSKSSQVALERFLEQNGFPKEAAEPLKLVEKPVQVGTKESAADFLVQLLPYMIVIWAFFGGMGSVADLVAGEKERLTLETLLIAPVRREHIALGKFFALMQICLLSSLSALAGVFVIGILNLPFLRPLFADGFGLSPAMTAVIVVVLIPTSAFFAALMLAVSTYARNIREAQTQLSLVSFVVLIPAMLSQVIGFLDFAKTLGVYAVPVLNTAAVIREALMGKTNPLGLVISFAVLSLLAGIALLVMIRLFRREQVLVRI